MGIELAMRRKVGDVSGLGVAERVGSLGRGIFWNG